MVTIIFSLLALVALVDSGYEAWHHRDYRRAISLLVASAMCVGIVVVAR